MRKWKKLPGVKSFYTRVPKIATIWCMLPAIRSATDISFCYLGPFSALLPHYWAQKKKFGEKVKKPGDIILLHMCTRNEDHTYGFYSFWDIKARWREFVDILGHFLPFDPPNNNKKKLTLVYHKWRSYDVWFLRLWDMECNRIFCHFGLFFALRPS